METKSGCVWTAKFGRVGLRLRSSVEKEIAESGQPPQLKAKLFETEWEAVQHVIAECSAKEEKAQGEYVKARELRARWERRRDVLKLFGKDLVA